MSCCVVVALHCIALPTRKKKKIIEITEQVRDAHGIESYQVKKHKSCKLLVDSWKLR